MPFFLRIISVVCSISSSFFICKVTAGCEIPSALEAFEKVADGKSTKIIIPADIQNMAGLVSSIAEVIK